MDVEMLLSGESKAVEYKAERPGNSKSYVKSVVAFSNARGGVIVFGVDDKTREIIGIPSDRVFSDMDAISNAVMDSVAPQVMPDISVTTVRGKTLILLEVPAGRSCPYYIKSEGLENGVYVRVGATTRHADLEWARVLGQECASGGFDRLPRRGATVTEDQINALCERMYEVALSRASEDRRGFIRKVSKSQLVSWGVLCERDGELLPTNAFLILTGDSELVRPLQCAVFKDDSRATFLDRRDVSGDLMAQIDGAYLYALEKMNMGADLDGVVRRDVYEIPAWSVREVITNAVLHRSYVERSSTQVALYADRLEVSSPGGVVRGFTLERAMQGESRPRNEALAQAFLYMNLIESWGSGIPRVNRECAEAGLRKPEFADIDGLLRVNLWRPSADEFAARLRHEQPMRTDRQSMAVDRQSIAVDGQSIEVGVLPKASDRDKAVLELVGNGGEASASELAESLGLSKSRMRAVLQEMAGRGLIVKVGDKRYTRYVLPQK